MNTRRYQVEWILLGTTLLILGALIGYWLYTERNQVDSRERDRLQTQARVIDENLGRQLEGANNALAGVRDEFPLPVNKSVAQAASRHLKALSDAMPGVRTMLLVDAEGTVLAANRDELIGLNASEREYFTVPRARPDPAVLYVSPPFSTTLGTFSIVVVRVVTGSRGEFAGIVSATLDPEYFNVVLGSVLYAPDMWASLAHENGKVFIFIPPNEQALGVDLNRPGSFRSRHLESGQIATVMTGTSSRTGEERMMAQRTVRRAGVNMDKAIGIAVSRDVAAIYLPWRRQIQVYGLLYAVFAAVTILGMFFYQRRQLAQDRIEAVYEAERMLAQKTLREALQRLKFHAENSPLAVVEFDREFRVIFWSNVAQQVFGWSAEEILGKRVDELRWVHEEDVAKVTALSADMYAERRAPSVLTNRNYRKDGSVITCEWYNSALIDSAGDLVSVLSLVVDVTERRRSEDALRESEARFRAIASQTPDHILMQDRDLRYQFVVNPQLGLTEADMIDKTDQDILAPEDAENLTAIKRKVLETGESVHMETSLQNSKGETEFFEGSYIPKFDSTGKADGLIGYFRNITERKRTEQALHARETQLSLIHDNAHEVIFVIRVDPNDHFRFISVNRRFMEATGLREDQIVGKLVQEVIPEPAHALVFGKYKEAIRNKQPAHWEEVSAYPVGKITGEVTVAPIFDANGNCTQLIGTVHDITDRKRAEDALRKTSQRLRNLSQRLIEVEDGVRRNINRELHDRVGASLSALNLNLSIVRSQLSRESLRAVGTRLQDTQKLIEETTTHVRDLMADLHPPALDDYGLLAALQTYAETLGARTVTPISVHGEAFVPRLPPAAETALFRVAQGALVNAVTHAHAKRIEILLAASTDRVTLTIADDGAGFDVTQATQARASWGLAIMRERAEAVGAELSVESTPGEGTRVCVEISREKR